MAKIASKVMGEGFVRFEFADGQFLQCDAKEIAGDIMTRLVLHGISQKVGDSYAGAESIGEARLMAQAVWNNLKAGIWAAKATRGGKIVEALHRATGQPLEACLAKWTVMEESKQKALRKHPDIKRALAEIEAERAAALAEAAVPTEDTPDLGEMFN